MRSGVSAVPEYSARFGTPTEQVLTIAATSDLRPLQVREGGPAEAHHAEHVDVEHTAPLVVVIIGDPPARTDPGVVDEDVDAAEPRDDPIDGCTATLAPRACRKSTVAAPIPLSPP